MKVILAGFNVDIEALKKCQDTRNLTPETLSAAYARISRSPKSVYELRRQARQEVEKARQSNRKIIFSMGHHSVAEHAVFNFDIIGISRLAVEELEHYRLCSYTEKSQRYVTLQGDHVVPEELQDLPSKNDFTRVITLQNNFYKHLFKKIVNFSMKQYQGANIPKQQKKLLENLAKEDARYVLSLATQAQLGMTVNARSLELMIRRFASHRLHEMRELGAQLYDLAARIAPSILLFCGMNDFDQKTYPAITRVVRKLKIHGKRLKKESDVMLVNHTRNADDAVLTALLFRTSGRSYSNCKKMIATMSRKNKCELFKQSCRHVELYDTLLREFEQAQLTFALRVSAGCYGQLKRHRMATLICQNYDPQLGVTIPTSMIKVKEKKMFMEIVQETEKVFRRIERHNPGIGSYVLTNAHRRRLLMSMNLRELYHVSRLREDPTAQWDIRDKAARMSRLARRVMPICTQLLGGKEKYYNIYHRLFKKYPAVKYIP